MGALTSILALIVTLGILVTIHEYGHFWVARRCGVKVLRFSVGFGKVLYSWHDKQGTEFAIAAIPLGGYVKMLDEREGEVPEDQLDQAFNRKTVWQRMAVVSAGPIANFLFAIFAYWIMFMTGITQVKPLIGDVADGSIAATAGLQPQQEITAVDGEAVNSWSDVNYEFIRHLGETGQLEIEVNGGQKYQLELNRWLADAEEPNPVKDLGITPYRPSIPPILDELTPGDPAQQAGLQTGDQVLAVDGESIAQWQDFVAKVQDSPSEPIELTVLRGEQTLQITLIPKAREVMGESGQKAIKGFAGARVQMPEFPEDLLRVQQFNPIMALWKGAEKTWDMSVMTLQAVGKMIQGLMSVKNLSGPITIAKVASDSAKAGFEAFLSFLAYVSIMLGVVNLLPVPVLDGGHLFFYMIEAARGKPLSEKIQLMGMKIGLALLMSVMVLAIFNDISRL